MGLRTVGDMRTVGDNRTGVLVEGVNDVDVEEEEEKVEGIVEDPEGTVLDGEDAER